MLMGINMALMRSISFGRAVPLTLTGAYTNQVIDADATRDKRKANEQKFQEYI
jgi:hypothetical protein